MPEPDGHLDECPHCGAAAAAAWEAAGRERATCRSCALQLVRRPGDAWHGIRG